MSRRPDLGYFDEGVDLADPASYAAARGDAGPATALPSVAYRSLTFVQLEDEAVWTRDWVAIGTVFEIPEEGDLLPFTAGYHGIHVQRGPDGALAGRFNKAQHGGCRAVPAQCQVGTKTKCSFTSCGYSRDRGAISMAAEGDNLPTMHQYLGLRPERLFPVSVATVGPIVFANLDPECSRVPLEGLALPDALMAPGTGRVHGQWFEFAANWKMAAQALAASDGQVAGDRLQMTGVRTLGDGRPVEVRWLFPNAVILTAGRESCFIVVQQTAIEKTLFRVQLITSDGQPVADPDIWLDEIARAGKAAEALQREVRSEPHAADGGQAAARQGDPVGLWGQARLIERVEAMPRGESALPMYQGARQYMI